jgi:hypothetical protein
LAWDDPNWSSLQGVFDEAWYVYVATSKQTLKYTEKISMVSEQE